MASNLVALAPADAAGDATAGVAAGVVTDLTWYISRPDMDRSIALMRDAGVKWVRANMNWASVEPGAKGSLDQWWLDEIDYAVRSAQAAGLQVLMPIADGVPYWASADPGKYGDTSGNHWNKYWRPSNFTDYADFARSVASRYGALGVHTYEIWNEPNYVRFWPSGPSAAEYAALLRVAYPALKQADPSARVVLGGLSLNDYGFLQQLYDVGAAPYFDVAAVHPYTGNADPTLCWYQAGSTRYAKEAFCGIEEVRRTMLANGDGRDLWLTEFGWSTASVPNGVSEATQAAYLTKAFERVALYPYVTNAFWYGFRNNYWQADNQTDLEADYGLTKVDFTQKPAYAAFKAHAATSTGQLPTTDVQPPVLSGIRTSGVSTNAAAISWSTNEAATSTARYWSYGSAEMVVSVAGLVMAHQIVLGGLQRRTRYWYRVESTDSAGNTSVSTTSSFRTAS